MPSAETPKFVVGIIGVIRKNNRYLILKRGEHKSTNPGMWEMVAGKMEIGENPRDTLVREVFEESGLHVSAPFSPFYAAQATRGNEPMLLLYYLCEDPQGSIELSQEHSEYTWIDKNELSNFVSFQEMESILKYLN